MLISLRCDFPGCDSPGNHLPVPSSLSAIFLVAALLASVASPVLAQPADPLQPSQGAGPVTLDSPWYQPGQGLRGDFEVACPDGAPPRLVTVGWEPVAPPLLEGYGYQGSVRGEDLDVMVSQQSLDALCHAPGVEPGDRRFRVESLLRLEAECEDGSLVHGMQGLDFDLYCEGFEAEVKTPTTTVGSEPPAIDLQLFAETAVRRIFPDPDALDDGWGGEVALRMTLGPEARNWLRLALGRNDLSGEVALVPRDLVLPRGLFDEIFGRTLEVDLDVTTLDVIFGRDLVDPDRKVVPAVFAGVGYAWVEAEGETREGDVVVPPSFPELPVPIGDSLGDLDEGGFSAVAGLALRLALADRCYLELGAQERWLEGRSDDAFDTEVFFRIGVPIGRE